MCLLRIWKKVKAGHVDPGMFRDDHLDLEMEEIRDKLRNRSPTNQDIEKEFEDIELEVQARQRQKQELRRNKGDEQRNQGMGDVDDEGFFGAEDIEVGD